MIEFKNQVTSEIGDFLHSLHFVCDDDRCLKDGLVAIIDNIADYYEEGSHLYPEIILIDNMGLLNLMTCHTVVFYNGALSETEFERAVKMGAPLAVNGWDIFICVPPTGNTMTWGLLTAELTVNTVSLYKQVLDPDNHEFKTAIIRNLGKRIVSLKSVVEEKIISFSLLKKVSIEKDSVTDFAAKVVSRCVSEQDNKRDLFIKMVDRAFKTGHGNLLAVVEPTQEKMAIVQEKLTQGVYFSAEGFDVNKMVDEYLNASPQSKEICASQVNNAISLGVSMMNHDGVTLFSNDGKILGYHLIVDNSIVAAEETGGARTKAFKALVGLHIFDAVLIKKQEGDVDLNIPEDDGE